MGKQLQLTAAGLAFATAVLLFLFLNQATFRVADVYHQPYFDSVLHLKKLSARFYNHKQLNATFSDVPHQRLLANNAAVTFKPLGYEPSLNLQYTHIYSPQCVYRFDSTVYRFAEVAFPNPCLAKGKLFAEVTIANRSGERRMFHARLFYQNTTYWFPTNDEMDDEAQKFLDNYYGCSAVHSVELAAGEVQVLKIPYSIGLDPKGEFDDPANNPARPGNYEFMLLVEQDTTHKLLRRNLDLQHMNPFAEVKRSDNTSNIVYTKPNHFKFVFLEERFDGTNDTALGRIYIPYHKKQKQLCDTCSGWFKDVTTENWKHDDFYGFIQDAPMVKAEYGQRRENVSVSSDGVKLKIPGSTAENKQKTWGEFFFGQAFKYGKVTVRAKLAPMLGKGRRPNGIIHNIWLYQRDHESLDTAQPYSYLHDPNGTQKYEIDFEIWSSTREWQAWDDKCNVNFAVVDYMRNPDVMLKPDMEVWTGKTMMDRHPKISASVIGEDLSTDWFNRFHTFEILWEPNRVRMFVDGKEGADFTPNYISIPDKHLFLWIGSPIYQDGTFYSQTAIPFLESGKETIIDYIKIE